jgi:PAS domain S-box-containing protein
MTRARTTKPNTAGPAPSAAPGAIALVLLDSLPDAIQVLDRNWRITFANEAYARYAGLDSAQAVGVSVWDLIPRDRAGRLEEAYGHVMATGQSDSFLQESILHPGRTLDVRVFPVFDGVAVVLRDVTRRISAERALAVSEDHLQRALNGAGMGHWSWEAATDRMFLSERILALYDLKPEHQRMTREDIRRLAVHPDDVAAVAEAAVDAQARQGQYEAEYRVRRNGEWRWMRVIAGPHIIDGEVVGMHGLVQDIHDLTLAEERLRAEIDERERGQQRQLLLIHELNHRVKNILAMVQAIAIQTLSSAPTPEAARKALDQRLVALAQAHDILTREGWDGAELGDVIDGAVAAHQAEPGARFRTKGPRVRLEPKVAVSLSMVLHELATNAVKYGALSCDEGWVSVTWTMRLVGQQIALALSWTEHDGPVVKPPERTGFGSRLITRSLAAEEGSAELIYAPKGLECHMALLVKAPAARSIGLP